MDSIIIFSSEKINSETHFILLESMNVIIIEELWQFMNHNLGKF